MFSDAEMARRLRMTEPAEFVRLAELIGNDVKAAKALREELEFILAHKDLPRTAEFAAKVRGWLTENKLDWSQENLEKAVAASQSA